MNVALTRFFALLVLVASAIPFSGGCHKNSGQSDCVTACAEANACPGAMQNDCATLCNQYDTAATSSGCTSQYDSFMTCLVGLPSECNTSSCDGQFSALSTCLGTYCMNNPTMPFCK
jgi:hypothetical protein